MDKGKRNSEVLKERKRKIHSQDRNNRPENKVRTG
jgi:hypothetical protein